MTTFSAVTGQKDDPKKDRWYGAYSSVSIELSGGQDLSQKKVLDLILDLVDTRSVIDLGCGKGQWSRHLLNRGINDIVGCDLDDMPIQERVIPAENFHATDLTQPLDLHRKFDLAISVEVGEHLPPEAAGTLVSSITRHSDIALFSAATPLQGGVGHINENWMEFWNALFQENGFVCIDCVRHTLWNDPSVRFYYRQNLVVFAHRNKLPELEAKGLVACETPRTLIHPEMLLKIAAMPTKDLQGFGRRVEEFYRMVRAI